MQIVTGRSMQRVSARRIASMAAARIGVDAAVFGAPLLAYLATMAPTIYNLDSAELTTAAASGGLMRATGYPLYLLIGRFWSALPLGDVGYRMNLLSAVCGALGVWLVYRIMRRIEIGATAAAGAAGLMAAAPFYWSLSLVAEVYTLQVVLVSVSVLLLLRWVEAPSPWRLAHAAGWFGLSAGHHLSTALLLPGAAVFVLAHAGRRALSPGSALAAALGAAAGLSIYLYLPLLYLASPAFNYAGSYDAALIFHPVDLTSVSGLWWLVSGKSFASQMFAYQGAGLLREMAWYLGHLGRAFLYIGIGPGLFGLGVLAYRRPQLTAGLALMFGASAFFYIDYAVVDKETMFLPTYLFWAVFTGVGYQTLIDLVRAGHSRRAVTVLQAIIFAAVLLAAVLTGPKADLSGDRTTRNLGEEILGSVRIDAVVFGWWDTVPPVQYLQLIEGQRPDVTAVNRFLIPWEDMEAFVYREAAYRPVYMDSFPDGWADDFHAYPVGSLFRLEPRDFKERDGYPHTAR